MIDDHDDYTIEGDSLPAWLILWATRTANAPFHPIGIGVVSAITLLMLAWLAASAAGYA
jgi:hypothetical protein